MPLGIFQVTVQDVPQKAKPVKPAQPAVQTPPPAPKTAPLAGAVSELNVQLLARTPAQAQQFLCAVNVLMGEEVTHHGLSFYTRDYETISAMVTQRKQLENFFWESPDGKWPTDGPCDLDEYQFSVSPAGNQQVHLDLNVRCVTPATAAAPSGCVWVLCDAALWEKEDDDFVRFAKGYLANLPAGATAFLLLSQFEHKARFRGEGAQASLPGALRQQLFARARQLFGDLPCAKNVYLLPMQVYGGLEFASFGETGAPVLAVGSSGFYQKYMPEGCHMAPLWSVEFAAQDPGFLTGSGDVIRNGLSAALRAAMAGSTWRSESLAGEEADHA